MNHPFLVLLHVAASLVGLGAGLIAIGLRLAGGSAGTSGRVFLVGTALSTVTGFLLPLPGFSPAVAVGILSVPLLVLAAWPRPGTPRGHAVRAGSAAALVYLNALVLTAQLLMKVPPLRDLAPSPASPAFAAAQAAVLACFAVLGTAVVRAGVTSREARP